MTTGVNKKRHRTKKKKLNRQIHTVLFNIHTALPTILFKCHSVASSAISSSLSSLKERMSIFSFIRWTFVLLGMIDVPLSSPQRSKTCAGVLPFLAAMAFTVSSNMHESDCVAMESST
jgi:hypothetical protein